MIRRSFLLAVPTVSLINAQSKQPDKGPPLSPELVKEFVVAGHGKLERVKEMLGANPALIRAAWDWGGGDFETALGGAGHMAQREIAEYLIAQGAPLELPAAAMLGRLDFVKAAVTAFPNVIRIPGPHRISLLAHARKSGSDEVVKFLESVGAS